MISTPPLGTVQNAPVIQMAAFLCILRSDSSAHLFLDPSKDSVVVCRLGNDSQLAADALRRAAADGNGDESRTRIVDVIGGLRSWRRIDKSFPDY